MEDLNLSFRRKAPVFQPGRFSVVIDVTFESDSPPTDLSEVKTPPVNVTHDVTIAAVAQSEVHATKLSVPPAPKPTPGPTLVDPDQAKLIFKRAKDSQFLTAVGPGFEEVVPAAAFYHCPQFVDTHRSRLGDASLFRRSAPLHDPRTCWLCLYPHPDIGIMLPRKQPPPRMFTILASFCEMQEWTNPVLTHVNATFRPTSKGSDTPPRQTRRSPCAFASTHDASRLRTTLRSGHSPL